MTLDRTQHKLDVSYHQGKCEGAIKMLPLGEWSREAHRVEFKHEGFDCLLKRSSETLSWCGYVAVKPDHPYYGKPYDDVPVDVHGGLTYAEACNTVICHDTQDPEDKVWWLGFDCTHAHDLAPYLLVAHLLWEGRPFPRSNSDHYWTQEEVIEETKKLAEQLRSNAHDSRILPRKHKRAKSASPA